MSSSAASCKDTRVSTSAIHTASQKKCRDEPSIPGCRRFIAKPHPVSVDTPRENLAFDLKMSDAPDKVSCRKSRENTKEEKRRMRAKRKKKLRKLRKQNNVKKCLQTEKALRECAQKESAKYKSMARTFWERWRWELQKRSDSVSYTSSQGTRTQAIMHNINPDLLNDPMIDGKEKQIFVGRGSFGVVRMQVYRGIRVAVKEFLPRTTAEDVLHEASILASLSHPNLPMLFGICLSKPYHRIIMQCHLLHNGKAVTVWQELRGTKQIDSVLWVKL